MMGTTATSVDLSEPQPDASGQVRFSRIGLMLPPALTYENWARAGVQIARIADSSAWCLGDWLICGQNQYRDRYQHAIEAAGLDYQTLRNYAWIARRFKLSRRRERLSFQHHAEVTALLDHEQDRWLDEAERLGWSRNQLRQKLREARGTTEKTAPAEEVSLPRVTAPRQQLQWWRSAAEHDGVDFEKWISVTLDHAAQLIIGPWPGDPACVSPVPQTA